MILPNLDKLIYDQLKKNANIYAYTCDMHKKIVSTSVERVQVESNELVQSSIPCLLVEMSTEQTNPNTLATMKRQFNLFLIDSLEVRDNYYFTNFNQGDLRFPDATYTITEQTMVKTTAKSGGLYAYLIEDLKMVGNNA
jgi:hypothetical protein